MATLKDIAGRKVSANTSAAADMIKQDFKDLFGKAEQAIKRAEREMADLATQTGFGGTDYDKLRKEFESKAKTHTTTASSVLARMNAFQKKLEAKAKQTANDKKAREKAAERAYRRKQIAEGKAAGKPAKAVSTKKAREAIEEVIINDNWTPMKKLTAEVVAKTIQSANAIEKGAKAATKAIKSGSKNALSGIADIFNRTVMESANALDTLATNAILKISEYDMNRIRKNSPITALLNEPDWARQKAVIRGKSELRKAKRKAKYTSKKVVNGITRYFYD